MLQLIYISSATSWPSEDDLVQLLVQARERNLRLNITGMLLYSNAIYFQTLEGEAHNVRAVYKSICQDRRNNGVVKLLETPIASRDFSNWSMGFQNLENIAAADVPGFVEIFQGRLDKDMAASNKSAAITLMMSFARDHG